MLLRADGLEIHVFRSLAGWAHARTQEFLITSKFSCQPGGALQAESTLMGTYPSLWWGYIPGR